MPHPADVAFVGVTDHAQTQLGDIVYVGEFPDAGDTVERGDEIGVIESVKTSAPIYAPLSGEVVEINETIGDELDKVSKDPYGEGWFVKFRLSHPDEIENLLDPDAYDAHCEEQA